MRGKIVRLDRGPAGTFGVLLLNDQLICWTLERAWNYNQPNISCIPVDDYRCERIQSPTFRETFEVMNVLGRTNILFHAGNTINDSKGCVLPGSRVGRLGKERAVLGSGAAFKAFMETLDGVDEFRLSITNG